jgi:PIN domain nuclease of toxin-antitoxin system
MTQQLTRKDIIVLPIAVVHLLVVLTLPLHHCAPFDRLLIAQDIIEQIAELCYAPGTQYAATQTMRYHRRG